MRLNDITKGVLMCVGMIVLIAIAGTIDYQDRMHFCTPVPEKDIYMIHVADTTESAYDIMRMVSESKIIPQ